MSGGHDDFETLAPPEESGGDTRDARRAKAGSSFNRRAPDKADGSVYTRSSEVWGARRARKAPRLASGSDAVDTGYTRSSEIVKPVSTRKRAGPSLKARAIDILSRREHSRLELQRKLAPHASDPDELEPLLDELERQKWLSTERFAQSLVHRRAASRGTQRIVQELRQHGVADEDVAQLSQQLQDTESDRAREVWERKFGQQATTQKDYARQYRFLASRGFSNDSVRRLLGAMPPPPRD